MSTTWNCVVAKAGPSSYTPTCGRYSVLVRFFSCVGKGRIKSYYSYNILNKASIRANRDTVYCAFLPRKKDDT